MAAADPETYTIGEIAERVDAPRRLVQFWAEKLLILPEVSTRKAGRGVHQVFSRRQLRRAAIAAPLAAIGLKIKAISLICGAVEINLDMRSLPREHAPPGTSERADIIRRAIHGEGDNFLVFLLFGGPSVTRDGEPEENQVLVEYVSDADGPANINVRALFGADSARRNAVTGIVDLTTAFAAVR